MSKCVLCERNHNETKLEGSCPMCAPKIVMMGDIWDPTVMSGYDKDEEDFLSGKTCNPDAPEECESCQ